jgi:hypothetical protein
MKQSPSKQLSVAMKKAADLPLFPNDDYQHKNERSDR